MTEPLFGMPPPPAEGGQLLDLVEAFVTDLDAAGRLTPMALVKAETLRELARVMLSKRRTGKTSTYSNDARLFSEMLTELGVDETPGEGDAFDALMREWREEADRDRGRPEVRDQA